MNNFDHYLQFGRELRQARIEAGLNQQTLADRIGVSRDLIVRMEHGDNVGIHHIISAMAALDLTLSINASGKEVAGSFDEFYQKRFRKPLETELRSNPAEASKQAAIVKPEDAPGIKVLNWNQAAKA